MSERASVTKKRNFVVGTYARTRTLLNNNNSYGLFKNIIDLVRLARAIEIFWKTLKIVPNMKVNRVTVEFNDSKGSR